MDDTSTHLNGEQQSIMSRAKLNGKLEHLDRQASLWISQAPRLRLGGIRATPQQVNDMGISGDVRDEHVFNF